jgi:hypothetical protein
LNTLEFTLLVLLGSFFAGVLGSLTGLGGGVVIAPLPALRFGMDVRYAIGASLVSVIATSSGAAAAYVKEGFSNLRIGMFLEIATTTGAIFGAFLAARISKPGGKLRDALGATALRIDHIGSTAVPGLAAKPIIDIQILRRRLRATRHLPAPAGSAGVRLSI